MRWLPVSSTGPWDSRLDTLSGDHVDQGSARDCWRYRGLLLNTGKTVG